MDNNETPKWLDELQQRSWEPEVLLSGIVLYGMFKVPPVLDKFLVFFKSSIYSATSDAENFIGILKLGIYWLILGLILHLIARGIWVGMVGLSYTFPNGINKEAIKVTGKFINKISNIPPFQTTIIRLEKLCSSLFSISFMLFMSILGAYLYLFSLIVIPFSLLFIIDKSLYVVNTLIFEVYVITVLFVGLIALGDFITLGYIRRFKWISKIYWPIHQLISALTLARFYRSIYYGFVSNYNKWIIMLILLAFTITSFYGLEFITTPEETNLSRIKLWHSSRGNLVFHGHYDDQNENRVSIQAQIPSDIIDDDVLRLFIPSDISKEDSIRKFANYDSLVKTKGFKAQNDDLNVVSKFYHIYLNDSLLTNLPWFYHYKTKTNQQGYLIYINIKNVPEGLHQLKIAGPKRMFKNSWAEIPFYRVITNQGNVNSLPIKETPEDEYFRVKPFGK